MKLTICDQFYSIQGEGKNIGKPALFVQFKNCQNACQENQCESKKIKIIEWLHSVKEFVPNLLNGAQLVFKGGETLKYQEEILAAIEGFKLTYGFKPYIEVSTLGKKIPEKKLADEVDLFVCSLELNNSDQKIDTLKALYKYKTIFKIIICNPDDYQLAKTILDQVKAAKKDIYLMPEGESFGAISRNSQPLAELCKMESVNFSTRLQLILWNKNTGC